MLSYQSKLYKSNISGSIPASVSHMLYKLQHAVPDLGRGANGNPEKPLPESQDGFTGVQNLV